MKTVYFTMPIKMRRNFKLVILLSISWMFVMFYYFQSGTTKVSPIIHNSFIPFLTLVFPRNLNQISKNWIEKYRCHK